jgi:hypothetical protein
MIVAPCLMRQEPDAEPGKRRKMLLDQYIDARQDVRSRGDGVRNLLSQLSEVAAVIRV